MKRIHFCLLLVSLLLAGCGESNQSELAPPQVSSGEHIGYYCNMIVANHAGPKGQIILENRDEAFWFTSVRDTLAFTFLPEEPKNIHAIYVTAMDNPGWDHPENDMGRWVLAQNAWYVIESEKRGGMGQAEAIPFVSQVAADKFAQQHGGRIVPFDEMPKEYILGKAP